MWFSMLLLLLVFVEQSLAKTSSREYCQLSCEDDGGNKHVNIGCDISGCASFSFLCKEILNDIDEFRAAMLKLHNTKRNEWAKGGTGGLQPITNMNVLNWDEDLEYLAKCWANYCQFAYNYCRQTPNFFNTGMNIAFSKRTIVEGVLKSDLYPYWEYAFNDNWVSIQPAEIGADKEKEYIVDEEFFVNHSMSIQIVWAATTHMGCARSEHKGPYNNLPFEIVCVYGPQGNRAGRKIFTRGRKACSECSLNKKCGTTYPYLCGDEEPIFFSKSPKKHFNFIPVFVVLFCKNMLYN